MRSDEIRAAFLDPFARQGHEVRVPAGIPACHAWRATQQPHPAS
ncbi:MAG: hypothetical protein ACJ8GN_22525 [Longimicrobiaceae bacterium]